MTDIRNVNPPVVLLDSIYLSNNNSLLTASKIRPNLDVLAYLKIRVLNNPDGVKVAMKKNGCPVLGIQSQNNMITQLYKLFFFNTPALVNILNDVPHNDTSNNYTNDSDFKQGIVNLYNKNTQ